MLCQKNSGCHNGGFLEPGQQLKRKHPTLSLFHPPVCTYFFASPRGSLKPEGTLPRGGDGLASTSFPAGWVDSPPEGTPLPPSPASSWAPADRFRALLQLPRPEEALTSDEREGMVGPVVPEEGGKAGGRGPGMPATVDVCPPTFLSLCPPPFLGR